MCWACEAVIRCPTGGKVRVIQGGLQIDWGIHKRCPIEEVELSVSISPQLRWWRGLTGKNTEELIAGLLRLRIQRRSAGLNLLKVAKQITMETLSEGFGSKTASFSEGEDLHDRKFITLDLVRPPRTSRGWHREEVHARTLYCGYADSDEVL